MQKAHLVVFSVVSFSWACRQGGSTRSAREDIPTRCPSTEWPSVGFAPLDSALHSTTPGRCCPGRLSLNLYHRPIYSQRPADPFGPLDPRAVLRCSAMLGFHLLISLGVAVSPWPTGALWQRSEKIEKGKKKYTSAAINRSVKVNGAKRAARSAHREQLRICSYRNITIYSKLIIATNVAAGFAKVPMSNMPQTPPCHFVSQG